MSAYIGPDGELTDYAKTFTAEFEQDIKALNMIMQHVLHVTPQNPIGEYAIPLLWHSSAADELIDMLTPESDIQKLIMSLLLGDLTPVRERMRLMFIVGYEAGEGEYNLVKCQCDHSPDAIPAIRATSFKG